MVDKKVIAVLFIFLVINFVPSEGTGILRKIQEIAKTLCNFIHSFKGERLESARSSEPAYDIDVRANTDSPPVRT